MISSIFSDTELCGEPTLEELLADPIVRMIMQRDGVNEGDMRGHLDRVKHSYKTLVDAQ